MVDIGLLNQFDIGQSEFLWSIRGNPNVKKVFAQIWNSNELCVSFDGAGCFRNWHLNPKWKTVGGWYHCDQVNDFLYRSKIISFSYRIHLKSLIDVPFKDSSL